MSSQQQTPQDDVRECANGCGFYGTSQTNYMCSKCFKDAQGATIASIEATPAPAPAPPAPPANPPSLSTATTAGPSALPSLAREPSMDAASASASASVIPSAPSVSAGAVVEAQAVVEGAAAAAAEAAAPATAAAPVQKKRNRCATCNKKVGLTGIECRCELVFCGLHRYPEAHSCTFDFKAHDRENLKQTVMGGGEFAKIDRL